MYDAGHLGAQRLESRQGRKVIVVVTDGGDTVSRIDVHKALYAAQLADAVIYAIVVMPITNEAGRNIGGEHALEFMAQGTGGRTFMPTIGPELDKAFNAIITNPAEWREDGLLVVRRRIDPNGPPHGCPYGCGPNLCKGTELEAFLKERGHFDQIVYVGDGSNDFCPILRLEEGDYVFVRRGMSLEKRIDEDGNKLGLRCQVRYWRGAWECEKLFQSALGSIVS